MQRQHSTKRPVVGWVSKGAPRCRRQIQCAGGAHQFLAKKHDMAATDTVILPAAWYAPLWLHVWRVGRLARLCHRCHSTGEILEVLRLPHGPRHEGAMARVAGSLQ